MWSWLLDVFQNILWNKTWIFWAWACKVSKALQPLFSFAVKLGQRWQSQSSPGTLNLCFCFEFQVWELLGNQSAFDCRSINQHYFHRYHDSWIQCAEFQDLAFNQFRPIWTKSPALNPQPWSTPAYKRSLYAISVASLSLSGNRKMMPGAGTARLFLQVFQLVIREPKKKEFRLMSKPGQLTSMGNRVSRLFYCSYCEADYMLGVMGAPDDLKKV